MESYERNTCSFIVKVWIEECADPTDHYHWRGHITHVHNGKRQYFENLANIVNFILPYLEELTVTAAKSIVNETSRPIPACINVYIHPYELIPTDKLMDGDTLLPITNNTLLIWLDLQPDVPFAHNTIYLLISPAGIQVESGQWSPSLNGKRIFYATRNPTAILSPFALERVGQSVA